ncbi:MAG: prepilin-type N-terminal cleavage/methylation domain-containing protein [Deferrisomatales bacterium]|nr:prepilin-type N-terminal cleavage/methylation domain-containing protein [Deferrisomatales bacterium]
MNKRKPRPRRAGGFTLVEVLIALVILAVGMAGVIPVMVQMVRGNGMARDRTAAAAWAQDKLEDLRRQPWGDPAVPGPATGLQICLTPQEETGAGPYAGLKRGWRATAINNRVYAIEVCAAAETGDNNYTDVCFSGAPLPAFHFFSLRTNL